MGSRSGAPRGSSGSGAPTGCHQSRPAAPRGRTRRSAVSAPTRSSSRARRKLPELVSVGESRTTANRSAAAGIAREEERLCVARISYASAAFDTAEEVRVDLSGVSELLNRQRLRSARSRSDAVMSPARADSSERRVDQALLATRSAWAIASFDLAAVPVGAGAKVAPRVRCTVSAQAAQLFVSGHPASFGRVSGAQSRPPCVR